MLSAERVNAGALLEQEQHATLLTEEGKAQPQKESAPQESLLQRDEHDPNSSAETLSAPTPVEESSEIKPLQTYRGDIEKVIHGTNASVVSIAAAEAVRRTQSAPEAAPELEAESKDKRKLAGQVLMVMIGLLLVATSSGLGWYVYTKTQTVEPVVVPNAPFVSVDETSIVSVPLPPKRTELMTALETAREGVRLAVGLIERVVINVSTTSAEMIELGAPSLISALAPNAPAEFLRTLEPTYLLGVHSFDSNQAFLVLGVDSYETAYAAMLRFEYTLAEDLSPLFTRTPSPHIGAGAASTTAAATSTGPVIRTNFADKIVENHDARVLQNSQGDILLLWTFLDRNTLVITTNEYTLREIISRRNTASLLSQP